MATQNAIGELAKHCFADGESAALVRVTGALGSTPRETGAQMLVTMMRQAGTIGGGQLEWLVLAKAREMLAAGDGRGSLDIPLGPEINQCCGGRVKLEITRLAGGELSELMTQGEKMNEAFPQVLIFGAGHTGKALALALEPLPFDVALIDSRAEALEDATTSVRKVLAAIAEAEVRKARPGSAIVAMTHSHDLDFLVIAEALSRGDAAYCGMIGSATKRAVFSSWLGKNGYSPDLAQKLVCPIGGSRVRDKRPEIIAALTAAEIITALHAFAHAGIVKATS